MKHIVHKDILQRTDKMGFLAPDQLWMLKNKDKVRIELQEAVSRLSGFINGGLVDDFDAFIKAPSKNYNRKFFKVLSLYEWSKVFNISLKR
jgi:hypothetical protein